MTAVRWASVLATPDGEIQYDKLRSLASILLALFGGGVLVAAMTGLIHPATEVLLVGVPALVLPLTGGRLADSVASFRLRSASQADPESPAGPPAGAPP